MDVTNNSIRYRENPNDKFYTPKAIATLMIDMCDIQPGQKVLDPSKGTGVFYDNLPEHCEKDWCEIDEGRDFFDYHQKVDVIVGNPPYSIWTKWVEHTCGITDKFCYIFSVYNFNRSRIRKILDKGFGVTKFTIAQVDWWYSNSYIVVFERNKPSIVNALPGITYCDVCGKRCNRGRTVKGVKQDPNVCTNITV